ncbi:transposase family protein [Streptomyces sp. NPDC000410]|uniref:helix-turn-helix domain-containing protein n=1 Tax=Streptomyces sp. NPDC000410 TaxID=3154254 RepID=UPI003332B922
MPWDCHASRPPGRFRARERPSALLLDNRVLLAAIAWRTNLTHRQLADLSGVGVATAHRILDRLTPLIAKLLEPPGGNRSDLWVADGTLIPVEDQTMTKCSKNYRPQRQRAVHLSRPRPARHQRGRCLDR